MIGVFLGVCFQLYTISSLHNENVEQPYLVATILEKPWEDIHILSGMSSRKRARPFTCLASLWHSDYVHLLHSVGQQLAVNQLICTDRTIYPLVLLVELSSDSDQWPCRIQNVTSPIRIPDFDGKRWVKTIDSAPILILYRIVSDNSMNQLQFHIQFQN